MSKQPTYKASKVKYKVSFGDRMISVITYIVYTFFAFVCAYPFYYIFINTISANNLSERGKIIFLPKEIHFTNYQQVMKIQGLFQALKVSLARTVVGTIVPGLYVYQRKLMAQKTLVPPGSGYHVLQRRYYPLVHHHEESGTDQ